MHNWEKLGHALGGFFFFFLCSIEPENEGSKGSNYEIFTDA